MASCNLVVSLSNHGKAGAVVLRQAQDAGGVRGGGGALWTRRGYTRHDEMRRSGCDTGKSAGRMNKPRVGVIGLGSMGGGVAKSLLRADFPVRVCDVRPEVVQSFVAAGAVACASPAELGAACDVVIVLVVNAEQTETVLFGTGGAAAAMRRGSVLLMSVTVPPDYAERLGPRLAERGILMIDGPVSGGEAKAATGEMTMMAAGAPEAFALCEPVLGAIATKVYRLGETAGAGSKVKMINQLLAGVHIAAAAEAMALGIKAGADPQVLYDVITNSAGNSWMFQNRVPHILAGDYTPALRRQHLRQGSGDRAGGRQEIDAAPAPQRGRTPDVPDGGGGRPRPRGRRRRDQDLPRRRSAGEVSERCADHAARLHRGRLHRRHRPRQHAGARRHAHHPDHRRARRAPRPRGGRGGGGAEVAHHPGAGGGGAVAGGAGVAEGGRLPSRSISSTARPSTRRPRATSAPSPTR